MDDTLRPPAVSPVAAAEVARQVNAQILEMAESLDSLVPNPRPIAFLCECGCFGVAEATAAEFCAAGGAWLDGHEPGSAAQRVAP